MRHFLRAQNEGGIPVKTLFLLIQKAIQWCGPCPRYVLFALLVVFAVELNADEIVKHPVAECPIMVSTMATAISEMKAGKSYLDFMAKNGEAALQLLSSESKRVLDHGLREVWRDPDFRTMEITVEEWYTYMLRRCRSSNGNAVVPSII